MNLGAIIRDCVKGPNGTYDPVRILFSIGGTNGVISPVVFQTWAFIKGQPWDVIAFCTGYGGMLTAIIVGAGIAISQKDKGVAQAQAIVSDTTIKEAAAS